MKDLQQTIGTWHEETFGPDRMEMVSRLLRKLEEEYTEWCDGYDLQEAADVIICFLAISHRMGWDLQAAVEQKFEIVRNRDQKKRDQERGLL